MKTIRLILVLAAVVSLKAEPTSRIAEILAERAEKTRKLQPDDPTKLEQRLDWLRDSPFLKNFGEIKTGLRIKLGGLVTGAGSPPDRSSAAKDCSTACVEFSDIRPSIPERLPKTGSRSKSAALLQRSHQAGCLWCPSQLPWPELLRLGARFEPGRPQRLPAGGYRDRHSADVARPAATHAGVTTGY